MVPDHPLIIERFAQQVDGFFGGGFAERFAALAQGLAETDGRILHALVRLGRAAHEQEMLAARQALMAVLVIQADAEEPSNRRLLAVFSVGHGIASRVVSDKATALTNLVSPPNYTKVARRR